MEFKDKVLQTRLQLNISQETLARELGITFATVNRWENGHMKPSILLENKFNQFCKNNDVNFDK
ncbi:MAG: helix-turn-helix transcriptional regulator [Clostridia bacterium]|nr:helix-turn-helix transcriptional regulator [Clostridia bacterium]